MEHRETMEGSAFYDDDDGSDDYDDDSHYSGPGILDYQETE